MVENFEGSQNFYQIPKKILKIFKIEEKSQCLTKFSWKSNKKYNMGNF
ncbi:unnamed protein product [marine sediment metagenome]|uniref:Uncharacterized protein n=1 Tax=marine sediment metagenome TaxID=412755 RepID=X0RZ50_9ZZZZ